MRRPSGVQLLALAHFLVLGVSASCRHLGGQSNFYDLGVMDNIVWQTVHGRLFFYPQYEMSYLGDHFAAILFLFVPLYAICAHPLVLVLGQALALAIGGLFVHRIALFHLGRSPRAFAWVITLIYALQPALLHIAMFDFHPIALMIPLSLAAYDCYLGRRWLWLSAALVLLAFCQEEAAISIVAFGLYMLAFARTPGERWIGAATSVTAALYFVLVMTVVIPAFQPHAGAGWVYVSRYPHLGHSLGEVMRTIVLHPFATLARSFEPYKLWTLLYLFLPLGLLSLLGWRTLLVALPSLTYTYLSAHPNQFSLQYQYFSPALPWLVVAAVQGLGVWVRRWTGRVRQLRPRPRSWWAPGLPLAVALAAAIGLDLILSPINQSLFRRHPYRGELEELRHVVGPEASLSATNHLAPFFAHRREYFLALDFQLNRSLNAARGLPDYHDTSFHLFDLTDLAGSQDRERRVARLLGDERYGVRYYRFPLVLFERGFARRENPELEALIDGDGDSEPGTVRAFPAVFLAIRDPGAVERDLGDNGRGATVRFVPGRRGLVRGPGVILPAGSYAVDFHLRLDAPAVGSVADLSVTSDQARIQHAVRRLTAADFTAVGRCQPFTTPIELPAATTDVEFRTRSLGPAFALCKVVVRARER